MKSGIYRIPNSDDFGFMLCERNEKNKRVILGRCFYSPPYVVSDFQAGLPELIGDGRESCEYYIYEQPETRDCIIGVSAIEFMEHFEIDPDDIYSADHCQKETDIYIMYE
jgi:hypothetical protein